MYTKVKATKQAKARVTKKRVVTLLYKAKGVGGKRKISLIVYQFQLIIQIAVFKLIYVQLLNCGLLCYTLPKKSKEQVTR